MKKERGGKKAERTFNTTNLTNCVLLNVDSKVVSILDLWDIELDPHCNETERGKVRTAMNEEKGRELKD